MPDTPDFALTKTVVLVGMMGSGKTAIGRSLAARLDVPFQDSDTAIEEAAALTIAEIFSRDGEPFFRRRETEVLRRLVTGPVSIVSTGGGAFMTAENRGIIAADGIALWLDATLETLWERVRHKDTRPLLRTPDPKKTLTDLYHDRRPVYAKAGIRLAIDPDASIEQTTETALGVLTEARIVQERAL
ncbi:shikimate kinase [Yoonia sp. SS1-5]|uniref:Shikimate kinase n=1 Tax=Yoonia rhodophyticola TaxID=3137370 RepID=A0AAN0NJS0_9RHOB